MTVSQLQKELDFFIATHGDVEVEFWIRQGDEDSIEAELAEVHDGYNLPQEKVCEIRLNTIDDEP